MTKILIDEAVVRRALEALLSVKSHGWNEDTLAGRSLIAALRQALEQIAQPCKYGNEPASCTSNPMDCQCAIDAVFEQPVDQVDASPERVEKEAGNKHIAAPAQPPWMATHPDQLPPAPPVPWSQELESVWAEPDEQPAPAQQRPPNCGTGYCSCIECLFEQPAPAQEPVVTYGEVEQAMQALRHGTFLQKQMYEAMKDKPLYTTPPAQPWVGLTDEDKAKIVDATERDERGYVMALVEAKLKEKNT